MSRVSKGFRITGKIIKFFFFLFVFSVIALLLWRVFSSGDPKSMKSVEPNLALADAYAKDGESLYMFDQNLDRITRAEKNYGYFAVTDCLFIPQANQIQIVLRYNNSTIRNLAQDYSLDTLPSREEEIFDVSLTVATDLTPEDATDNAVNDPDKVAFTRIHPTSVTKDTKNMYNFRRLTFDLGSSGLSLTDLLDSGLLLAVYTDIYYTQNIDYTQNAYGTLCLYDYLMEKDTVKLSRSEMYALEEYLNNHKEQ